MKDKNAVNACPEDVNTHQKRKSSLLNASLFKNAFQIFLNVSFLIFNLLIEFAKTQVSVQLSLYLGQTTGALISGYESNFSHDSWIHFLKILGNASIWIILSSLLKTIQLIVIEQMTILWRWYLVSNLHRVYFADKRFYWSSNLVQNVDQRIQADTDTYVNNWQNIMQNVVGAPMTIVVFSYNSFLLSGWQGPVSVYAFFLAGLILNKILIGPVSKRWDRQMEREGDWKGKGTGWEQKGKGEGRR